MKKGKSLYECSTIKERIRFLFSALFGIMMFFFIPEIIKEYAINLTFPDVVSFYRLEAYILAGVTIYAFLVVLGLYTFITGNKSFVKFKGFIVWSCRITMFNFVIATIFNWHFTTELDQQGYGTCWKSSLYGETLYIKDASECKKRGLSLLKKPRPAY